MKKTILILVVSVLVLSGLGAVALPNEKHIENKPLNTQDILSIWIDAKLSGYEVSITNVGNESVTGNLTLNITTDAWIMLVGETLGKELALEVDPEAEGIEFKMGSVFGFGPATITIEGVFKPTGDDDYPFEAEIRGFVLLSFVTSFATNIIIP